MKTFNNIKWIVIHCSATAPDANIGRAELDAMHKARGWNRIGYHLVIKRNGDIEQGRELEAVGAHTKGYNKVEGADEPLSWGVCLVGGISFQGSPTNNFTMPQMNALQELLPGLMYKAPHAQVLGHRDLSPDANGDGVIDRDDWLKECPCFDVRTWLSLHGLTRASLRTLM